MPSGQPKPGPKCRIPQDRISNDVVGNHVVSEQAEDEAPANGTGPAGRHPWFRNGKPRKRPIRNLDLSRPAVIASNHAKGWGPRVPLQAKGPATKRTCCP
jgi:hypothetical protein